MPYVESKSVRTPGLRRGLLSGLMVMPLLLTAALPARLAAAFRGWGSVWTKTERTLAGALVDLSAVVLIAVPLVAVMTLLLPVFLRGARGPRWQRLGASLSALPLGFGLWALTVAAQEIKSERGSFPTVFDLLEGANASFVEGTVGFLRYERIWAPAAVGCGVAVLLLALVGRRPTGEVDPWKRWMLGLGAGLGVGAGAVLLLSGALASTANRFTTAALGDPLTGLVESTVDLLRHRGPSTPRDLVLEARLPEAAAGQGAALLGWPPLQRGVEHPHRRALDFKSEPPTTDARGRALVQAERIGCALRSRRSSVVVFHLRRGLPADDLPR